ncbi:MAG: VCBS repeat-containing protein [Opitutaceae bacterium]|nr:VCBS repeat-containing protein [Opitutaceae bacterium]
MNRLRPHVLLAFAGCATLSLTGQAAPAATANALPFRAQTIDTSIKIGYGLAVADVDGDGRDDLLLADAREIAWYRNPSWSKSVMVRDLTPKDHVCIAARDIDGDGRAEVAVGAEWNPGDTTGSGALFYLERPADPTQPWRALRLPHEPTTHRMHWLSEPGGGALLAVLPLHGRGNKAGEGVGIRFLGYRRPARVEEPWPTVELDGSLHLAHNFDPSSNGTSLLVAAKEGVHRISQDGARWSTRRLTSLPAGEVRSGRAGDGSTFVATIEPMHGHQVAVYPREGADPRVSLDENLIQGHGLATGDLLGLGHDQVVAGWRGSGPGSQIGIRLYAAGDARASTWSVRGTLDDAAMACEDLKVADLDGDGDLDLIACGRATHNVIIYWNERIPSAPKAAAR